MGDVGFMRKIKRIEIAIGELYDRIETLEEVVLQIIDASREREE